MASDDLAELHITSGVTDAGDAFCHVSARTEGGRIILGQLPPAEVRALALAWLGAAEAAEQDAAVLRVVRTLDLPDNFARAVVVELRNTRGDGG